MGAGKQVYISSKKNTKLLIDMKCTVKRKYSKSVRSLYFWFCFVAIAMLGGIRSAPVYGKLDFLTLDSKPWLPGFRPMIINLLKQGRQSIVTDPTTSIVLNSIFGQKTTFTRVFTPGLVLNVNKMNTKVSRCLINVRGFPPTWVPFETGHWNPGVADTIRFYRYNDKSGKEMVIELQEHPPENCDILF